MDDQPGTSSSSDPANYNQTDQWMPRFENILTPLDDNYGTAKTFYGGTDQGAAIDTTPHQISANNNNTSADGQTAQKRKVIPYDVRKLIKDFWPSRKRRFEAMNEQDFKQYIRHMELPMARVKKIMKIDDEVKQQMISQDAPLFLSAAAEIFIQEITLKSWAIVEEGRRKTLQKCDIASAVSREEHFDFLIDIVPREEARKYQMNPLYEQAMPTGDPQQQMQYVLADVDSVGNNVYQLDNGQIIQATAIGQPIPISDPNGGIDIAQLQSQGFQIVQMPPNM